VTKAADELKVRWERVMARLRTQIGDDIVSSWFSSMEVERFEAGSINLSVPTKFLKSWTSSRYGDRLLSLWQMEEEKVARIEIRVRKPGEAAVAKRARVRAKIDNLGTDSAGTSAPRFTAGRKPDALAGGNFEKSGRERGTPLDSRLTFQTFIIGRSNALAHAAAKRVTSARTGDAPEFNPLYIHGQVGVGKTHLLNSMAAEIRLQNTGRKVMLLSAVRFMAGFVEALKARDVHGFKQSFANIDVLLIDDIQFLRGDKVQQEFCHIFNMLEGAGKQIVIAGDMAPSRLETLEERIRSRLSGGLAAPIGPVDPEMRRGILDARARQLVETGQAKSIPGEVLNFIARRVQGSGRDLEGVLNQLAAQEKLGRNPITVDAAAAVIHDIVAQMPVRQIMIEDVLRAVTGHFNVSRADLLSQRRHKSVVYPRQVGMYLAKTLTTRSLPEIGRKFGGRDHTTVLHAVRKIERLVGEDVVVRNSVDVLRNVLRD